MKISVMGSGGWGTALALVLLENGQPAAGAAGESHAEGRGSA